MIIISLFIITGNLFAYDFNSEEFEKLLEKVSVETGTSPELDYYEYLLEHPVNLKEASIADFLKIPGFTSSEARRIITLCQSDTINSIMDLNQFVQFTDDQIILLSLFSTFKDIQGENAPKVTYRIRNKHYLTQPQSFTDGKIVGDELDLYQRINAEYKNFSLGLLTDKDFGERQINDFTSGYFSANLSGYKVILGDFYVESGFGSLLWKTFGARKGADVIYPMSQFGNGLKAYRSSINHKYFRGAGLEKLFSISDDIDLNVKAWYSIANRDGNYDSVSNLITSVYKQGYFRTKSEISKKSAFREQVVCSDLNLRYGDLIIGTTFLNLNYDREINTNSKLDFFGQQGNLFSAYGLYQINKMTFSGEFSKDANFNNAFKISSNYEYGNMSILLNWRSFGENFRSPYGYNFGESASPANEWGIYTGIRYNGLKNLVISGYFDYFGTYGKSYYIAKPYQGFDFLLQSDFKFEKKIKGLVSLKFERKPYDDYYFEEDTLAINKNKLKIKMDLNKQLSDVLNLRFRLDGVYVIKDYEAHEESGFAFLTDINYKIAEFIKVGGRFSLFATESYNTAIWHFEVASQGYMSTVPLYGRGYRAYIYSDISVLSFINLRFRYSVHQKNNTKSIGSGLLEILGNTDERLIIQLDIKY